jgi:putative tryptophan/tyrosine transport system substrate-binding protein
MGAAHRTKTAIIAFFDEMRLFGFIEGQNLMVLPNGFGVGNDELVERAEALVKAAPDVIISGPDNYTRVLQQRTLTIPLVAMTEDMRSGQGSSLRSPDRAAISRESACSRPNSPASGRKF